MNNLLNQFKKNALLISDAYKQSHRIQYNEGTELVYSNWTARSNKRGPKDTTGVVVFGVQGTFHIIHELFQDYFFSYTKEEAVESFAALYEYYFNEKADTQHVEDLYNLGYLPIKVKSLKEGTICPYGVPIMTIVNTDPKFFWITNFLETIISNLLWLPMTSATTAKMFYDTLCGWSDLTCDNNEHIPFQSHDFSMRGMGLLDAAMASGAGHLTSFVGSDTIPAIYYVDAYYGSKAQIATSIPATEHSVMSMGTQESELDTFRRLITKTYPNGFVSIVSDTWDFWKVLTQYLPILYEDIMKRDGKVVIRPDSGNPVDIVAGIPVYDGMPEAYHNGGVVLLNHNSTKTYHRVVRDKSLFGYDYALGDEVPEYEVNGAVATLYKVFGGVINDKGYKVLDAHIGLIYGDAITLERANSICDRLERKGFASSNIVFGSGSFTYTYVTRDTHGFAMKATYGEVDGKGRAIFKSPKTDGGVKKSLKGLLQVKDLHVNQEVTWEEERDSDLKILYLNGDFINHQSFDSIRKELQSKVILE
jgi:nicotinamide phosphoribosyltransferase